MIDSLLGVLPPADTLRTIMLSTAAAGQTTFVVLYSLFPWYRTLLGRVLYGNALALAMVMDVFIVTRVLGLGRIDVAFVFLYLALAIGMWGQVIAFFLLWLRRKTSGAEAP